MVLMAKVAMRFLRLADPRLIVPFVTRFGLGGLWAMWKFQRRLRRGVVFPPFLFISLTNKETVCRHR